MECSSVFYSRHGIERMFQRTFAPEAIAAVLQSGEIIAAYPDDTPWPSVLLLGYMQSDPVHVVVGRDPVTNACYVVTVYRPDPTLWEKDHKTRRQL